MTVWYVVEHNGRWVVWATIRENFRPDDEFFYSQEAAQADADCRNLFASMG